MIGRRAALLTAGLTLSLLAPVMSAYLWGGDGWLAAVGFWAPLGVPGLALLAYGAGLRSRPALPAAATLIGVSLLGLDVVDSARASVVVLGYCFTAVCVVSAIAALLLHPAGQGRRPLSGTGTRSGGR